MPNAQTIDQGIESIQRAIELASFARENFPGTIDGDTSINLILKNTFIRALKVHQMRLILIKYKMDFKIIDLFGKILQLAEEIINSCRENPISIEDTIPYCAYYRGHLDEAYGVIGSVYNERSKFSCEGLGVHERDSKFLSESVKNYENSLKYLPKDDPNLALFHYLIA